MSVTRKFPETFSRPRNPSIVVIRLFVLAIFHAALVDAETAKVCAGYTLATGLWENALILVDDGPCYDPFQLYDIADLTFDVNCTDVCGDCLGNKRSFSDERIDFNPSSEGPIKRADECGYYFSPAQDAEINSPLPICPHLQNVTNCAFASWYSAVEELFCTYSAQQGVSIDSDCFKTYQLFVCSLIDVEFNKLVFKNELDINMLSVSAGSLVSLGKQQGTVVTGPFCSSICEDDVYTSPQCGLMGASTCEASWDTCDLDHVYSGREVIRNPDGSRAWCARPCENGVSDCPAGETCYEFSYSGGSSAGGANSQKPPVKPPSWDLFASWYPPGIAPWGLFPSPPFLDHDDDDPTASS